jgi:hypothetical protein
LRCHKAQPTVGTGKFLHELVPEFHDKRGLVVKLRDLKLLEE